MGNEIKLDNQPTWTALVNDTSPNGHIDGADQIVITDHATDPATGEVLTFETTTTVSDFSSNDVYKTFGDSDQRQKVLESASVTHLSPKGVFGKLSWFTNSIINAANQEQQKVNQDLADGFREIQKRANRFQF